MTAASDRAELYTGLSEVLGADNASRLMNYLPGDQPATKSDVALLGDRMDRFEDRMDRFEDRMDRFGDRLQALDDKFDAKFDSFHDALLFQGRTFAIVSVTSIVATAGLVAGIVRALG